MKAACVLALTLTAWTSKLLYGEAFPAQFAIEAGQPPSINSPAFAKRGPLPGQPGYLSTIKYVDDGVRYVDPLSQFFVSPAGEMCFRTGLSAPTVYYQAFYRNWCIHPQFVDRVSVITQTELRAVELWCLRAYPQCAHALETGEIANRVFATTVDYQQERAALQHLIYMMGGNVRFSQPPVVER
jgi:hypothetical protein